MNRRALNELGGLTRRNVSQKFGLTRRDLLRASGGALLVTSATGCNLLSTDPAGQGEETASKKGKEAPMLAAQVKKGKLPPVEKRLPKKPLVVDPIESIGAYGGTWNSWLYGLAATYVFVVEIGYENLVQWDSRWTGKILPNIAESWEVRKGGEEYVFHLREGMKWSDGEPFTADDLVWAYNEVLLDAKLYEVPPSAFTIEQKPASIEKIDDTTIRFIFPKPSGLFLEQLAQPGDSRSLTIPRHYMEQFHVKFNKDANKLAKEEDQPTWVDLFIAKNDEWLWQNVDRPTLDAWILVSPPGEEVSGAEFVRNPYYWKTDPEGSQLPYLDRVEYDITRGNKAGLEVALLKTQNGEVDFNHPTFTAGVCSPANKPVIAKSREKGAYEFVDSTVSTMNQMIICLNLAHQDTNLREVFQNKDFRIGLSYAINRQELIDAVFQRQGEPWQAAPRKEEKELYNEELAKQYTEYDADKANEHLDRAGYDKRDAANFRLRPDGKRITFTVEVATEEPEQVDSMDLIQTYWREAGIDARIRTMDRTLFYDRKAGNLHDANVWTGDGGWGDVVLEPRFYFPFSDESNWAIPWALWWQSKGESPDGMEPPDAAKRQMDLYNQIAGTTDKQEQIRLFREILQIARQEFWVIGTVLETGTYGTVKKNFHNVPKWMPGSWNWPSPGPSRPEQYYKT